jgi:ribosomal protein S18 acetylase RimI-like enzyme
MMRSILNPWVLYNCMRYLPHPRRGSVSRKLMPPKWNTERLIVVDSTLDEAETLQEINDIVPQTQSWMQVDDQNEECSMRLALEKGVLPPVPERSIEHFRLQSIWLSSSQELIGFLGVYHGFPQEEVFWINTVTFHPKYQGFGYGAELLFGLSEIVRQLGSYTCMRTYVSLNNFRSLRLCVKVGLNKMLEIAGDKVYSEQAQAHVLLEKIIK